MKFITTIKESLRNLNEEQKRQSFLLLWEGTPIQSALAMKRIKSTLDRMHINVQAIKPQYDNIYATINKVMENQNELEIKELEKTLNKFYSKPITLEQKKYYPKIKNQLHKNLFPLNKLWLDQLTLDIRACERIEKNKLLERFGLPTQTN